MGFAAPWFLAALAAVGLPVWLHLLRRNRSTPLKFSSVMLFEPRLETSVRRRRLHYKLLFALRAALLLLLALAFARPYVEATSAIAAGRRIVVAIDVSASMREGNRLERAKSEARALLASAKDARVIALGRTARLLAGADLAALQPTPETGSLAELPRALRAIESPDPLEVHLFSDFQKTALPAAFSELALPPGAALVPHRIADSDVPNWAVESASAPPRVFDPKNARVDAIVRGYGTAAAPRRVSLAVNGRVVESREVAVPANGRAAVQFSLAGLPHGLNRGEIRLEPNDTLAADDRYWFAVERAEPRPVLFAGDARSELYFRAALEATPGNPFRLERGTAQARHSFVVIANATPPDWIEDYLHDGGAVLVALGPNGAAPLVKTARTRYYARDDQRFQTVSWVDGSHPVLKDSGAWPGVRFYQVAEAEGLKPLARLADGTPILSETRVGRGRLLVFGSTFDNVANDFPLHNAFVPFIDHAARYLSGLETAAPRYVAGSAIELTPGAAHEVLGPDGNRVLTLAEARTARSLELDREGFYEVRRPQGDDELIAVNADRRESDLAVAPKDTIGLWVKSGGGAGAPAGGAVQTRRRFELWPYLLALAIAAALAEAVVGRKYLEERREQPLRRGAAA